jgi:phosphoribosylaminoimidazolecarboxamide formyltransferase/IMP cyclohydrolase
MTRNALLSVWDKTGLEDFGRGLSELGFTLVSSGGTGRALAGAGLAVTTVEELTGVPELLDHRVVTLHPRIHGGILADRGKQSHRDDLKRHGIEPFDLVVVNLYPFRERPDVETIDVGGPAMVRAAAKNHAWVGVVTSPAQYEGILAELRASGALTDETRRRLAAEAFAHTAAYDAAIVRWLEGEQLLPRHLVLALTREEVELRYGENPHQQAALYRADGWTSWWDAVRQRGGLPLSYLNYCDTDAAWRLVHDLGDRPACAIIKHANPCGVAIAEMLETAYSRALDCDPRSAFGGVVALNRTLDSETVRAMVEGPQADVVVAPAYEPGTIEALAGKRANTRILEAPAPASDPLELRQLSGAFLVQEPARFTVGPHDWQVVTSTSPSDAQRRDAALAWRICGHVKSNAIVLVKDEQAVGIGAGQQNRVEAGEIAASKAAGRATGGACASDAFYPFPDGIDAAARAGVAVVIQPGGSVRDDDVIARANELGLAMIFTGERHFLH